MEFKAAPKPSFGLASLDDNLSPQQQLERLYKQADDIHAEQLKLKKTLDGLNNIVAMLPAVDRSPVLAEIQEHEASETKLVKQLATLVDDITALGGTPPQFAEQSQPSYNPIVSQPEPVMPVGGVSLYSNNNSNNNSNSNRLNNNNNNNRNNDDDLSDIISEYQSKPWFKLQMTAQEAEVIFVFNRFYVVFC